MLQIVVPGLELWDEKKEIFLSTKQTTLQLEHSLVSISKWEAKWGKAFLGSQPKSKEEDLDYVRCMTITQNVDPVVYYSLSNENLEQIRDYIQAPMTATHIPDFGNTSGYHETVTSELIYYWMIVCGIPMECQKWHLNRLLCLIRVCNFKNAPKKKMSRSELLRRNAAINEANKRRFNTRG